MKKAYFTTADLAALLSVTKETVKAAVDRGDIKATFTPGGHARIPEAEARRYVEARGGVWDSKRVEALDAEFDERTREILSSMLDEWEIQLLATGAKKSKEEVIEGAVVRLRDVASSSFGG